MRRRALGRGLEDLLPYSESSEESYVEIDLDLIQVNEKQPRTHLDQERLVELAASIEECGILQPIVVRDEGDCFRLIIGERRWRAAQLAGLTKIPAVVRDASDAEMLQMALVENLQREDLNPLEEAQGMQMLLDSGLTQKKIASALGQSRSSVANTLRLLALAPGVQAALREGRITVGHAKAIAGLDRVGRQEEISREVLTKGLSVRQTERLVQGGKSVKAQTRAATRDVHLESAETDLTAVFGTPVAIQQRGSQGSIRIQFHGLDELNRLYELLMRLEE